MSNDAHETIPDIVSEMRDWNCHSHVSEIDHNEIVSFSDRIEAAFKRLAIPTPEQLMAIAKMFSEVSVLRRENDRLRAALKPILDIVMDRCTSDLSMEMAIDEAKRIYNRNEDRP